MMVDNDVLAERMRDAYAEMEKNLRTSMYADQMPRKKVTLGDLAFKWKWRVKDAWSVLTGRADIG